MKTAPYQPPPLALMHLSFLFTGSCTLLLGPTLPAFALRWGLNDAQGGLLIAAQFFGLFLGAIALFRNLRRSLLCGYLLSICGLFLLSFALVRSSSHALQVFAFFLLGLGLGQVTTTVNLLAALRFPSSQQRSSALSLLTFTWSAGAVLASLIAGFYLAHASLFLLLITFAAFGFILLLAVAGSVPQTLQQSADPSRTRSMATRPLLYFFLIFLLYGGLEATLGGWISTYTLRYTTLGLAAVAYSTTALWAAFAAGRAIAAALLRMFSERAVRSSGLLLAAIATVALRGAHTAWAIDACAACIGLGIAPFFAVTFSLLMSESPGSRQAGAATANIGLGSAIFPYVTGVISSRTGSLHSAMVTPVAIALALFTLTSIRRGPTDPTPTL